MIKYILILILIFVFAGCSTQKDFKDTDKTEPNDYSKKRALGIDFFASGNEPFWSAELDVEDSIRIFIAGERTLRYPATTPVIDTAANIIMYKFDDEVTLSIKAEECVNSMSGEKNVFSVMLSRRDKRYTGCGRYIIATSNPLISRETQRLNDIWAIKWMDGKEIRREDFPEGIPYIELHLNDGKFYGTTNCNDISGNIYTGDSYLYFNNFSQTKKFCEGNFESRYISLLKEVDSWKLEKMQLSLRSKGKEIIRYTKID
ncbi:MAG: META domain-containing protein [Ignavibacteria bacterium]